jgi:chromosome segregation ATPase
MSEKKVENVWTATAQLMEGRQITINGNFYETDDAAAKHSRLDEAMDVLERQRKRFELPVLRKELEQRLAALQNNMNGLEVAMQEAKRKGEKVPAATKMTINNYRTNIEKIKADIEDGQKAIEELEREVDSGLKVA